MVSAGSQDGAMASSAMWDFAQARAISLLAAGSQLTLSGTTWRACARTSDGAAP
jgi:hypothetical protein